MVNTERAKVAKVVKPVVAPVVNNVIIEYGEKMFEALLNKHRHLYLYGNITSDSSEKLNKKLVAMAIDKPNTPIVLEINSGGGGCIAGLSIIDTMASIPCPIYTVVTGYAASMATFISIAGTKRYMTPNAYWMAHPISSMKGDYIGFLKDSMEWLNDLEKTCLNMYSKKTNIPKALIEKCRRGEVWLNAKQCLKYNVVDELYKKQLIVKG